MQPCIFESFELTQMKTLNLSRRSKIKPGINTIGQAAIGVLVVLLFPFSQTVAQQDLERNYTWLHYDIENGLPQNSVATITTDSAGYLWFATQSGLVRFDGNSFMVFNSSNVPGLTRSDRISWSGNDLDGKIYFRDEFLHLFRQNGPCSFEPTEEISSERILFTDYGGISDQVGNEMFQFPLKNLKSEEALREKMHTGENGITALVVMNKQEAYAYYKDRDKQYVFTYFNNGAFSILRSDDFVQDGQIIQLRDTVCFVNRHGAMAFYKKGSLIHSTPPGRNFISNNFTSTATQSVSDAAIHVSHGRSYYVADNSLYEIVQEERFVLKKRLLFGNLPCKFIASVYKIPGTSVFAIGTYTDGLYLIYPKSFGHLYYGDDPSDFVNTSYALLERNGEIVTHNFRYNYNNGKFTPFRGTFRSRVFFKDKEDYLWLHDWNLISKTKDYVHFTHIDTVRGEFKGFAYAGPDSSLFYMAGSEIGIIENDKTKPLVTLPGGPPSLAEHANVLFTTFLVYSKGIMVGTTKGLFDYDLQTNTFTEIDSATQVNIRTIYEDKEGNIWVGTYGQGLYSLKNGKLHKLPLDKNHNLSITHFFVEDEQGYFWIPTNNGLYKTRRQDLLNYVQDSTHRVFYYAFNKLDGLPFYEFNGGAMPNVLHLNGEIMLPTMKGIVSFVPERVYVNVPSKGVQVDFAELNGNRFDNINSLQLPPGFASLVIHISSPYYGNPDNLQIEYMVEGLTRKWRKLEGDKIEFNALPKGNYRIMVRKAGGFGDNVLQHSIMSFEVLPAFYETIWFQLIMGILLLVMVWLFIKIRTRYVVAQNLRLEKEVKERTIQQGILIAELQESNLQLKESEENLFNTISEKDRLISVLVHDLRSPLRFLKNNTSYLARNWKKHSTDESEKLIHEVDDATKQIHYLTEELMLWIATRGNKRAIDIREYPLKEITDELSNLYADIILHAGNRLEVEVPEDITVKVDKLIFKTIIRNLLDNSNKNTEEGIIRIAATQNDTDIIIELSDTGTGMSEEMLQDINQYLGGEAGYLSQNSQFGHKIIRDFGNILGAHIHYSNGATEGLIIKIVLKR